MSTTRARPVPHGTGAPIIHSANRLDDASKSRIAGIFVLDTAIAPLRYTMVAAVCVPLGEPFRRRVDPDCDGVPPRGPAGR